MIAVFMIVPAALAIAAGVTWAHFLSADGAHTRSAIRHARRESARARRAGFGQPARPPISTRLLEPEAGNPPGSPPWDLVTQLPAGWEERPVPPALTADLAALPSGTGQFPMLADDPPEPAADETGEISPFDSVYGVPPDNATLVDDIFARHAQQGMIP